MTGNKILIIDDDRDIRLGFHFQLRDKGFTTVFAEDGLSATNAARKEKPALILLDLGLPAGDGFVVLGRLQRVVELSCIPVIVVTARSAEENEARALAAGAFAFFEKPVDNNELFAAIEDALGLSGAR